MAVSYLLLWSSSLLAFVVGPTFVSGKPVQRLHTTWHDSANNSSSDHRNGTKLNRAIAFVSNGGPASNFLVNGYYLLSGLGSGILSSLANLFSPPSTNNLGSGFGNGIGQYPGYGQNYPEGNIGHNLLGSNFLGGTPQSIISGYGENVHVDVNGAKTG